MLRSKLRDSRATVQELQSEISNLKISLHEKEAGVLGFAGGSMEWPNSPGEYSSVSHMILILYVRCCTLIGLPGWSAHRPLFCHHQRWVFEASYAVNRAL